MKAKRLHLLRASGRAYCTGRIPSAQGEDPCGRCEIIREREAEKAARKKMREERAADTKRRLEEGILFQQYNGIWALRYLLDNLIVVSSLHEKAGHRARILAPLCMKQIRRTGRRLSDTPTCNADRV